MFIYIAVGWGRVFEIVSFRQLLLVKPAPTNLLRLVHFKFLISYASLYSILQALRCFDSIH